MSSRYLLEQRSVLIQHSIYARLEGHTVEFSLYGVPWVEPAFANLVPHQESVAHGVLHRISKKCTHAILQSESTGYQLRPITVTTAAGIDVSAYTLVGTRGGPPRRPSRRYLDLLIEGAKEHGLPDDYCCELKSIKGAYIPLVSEIAGVMVRWMIKRAVRC